jgi:hypothetical protein
VVALCAERRGEAAKAAAPPSTDMNWRRVMTELTELSERYLLLIENALKDRDLE